MSCTLAGSTQLVCVRRCQTFTRSLGQYFANYRLVLIPHSGWPRIAHSKEMKARFGSIEKVKERSDAYISAIENCPPRPGHSVRVPGSKGHQFIKENAEMVEVLSNHWDPFFVNIAGRYGLSEAQLREDFVAKS